ncbi:hypothetical protein JT359_13860 [Candidatus Poribacteria bacterium]|nr:hypothetical protein [Candidatus Poribacteria bacterium]
MRNRNTRVRRHLQLNKGDLLSQKWMTNLLTIVLLILIIAFITLSIPSIKKQVVNFVRVLLYGKEKGPARPKVAPVRLYNPLPLNLNFLQGY